MNKNHRQTAKKAVLQASKLCKKIQTNLTSRDIHTKVDRSPVTLADFCAQALISHHLEQTFPTIPLLAEECAGDLSPEMKAKGAEFLTKFANLDLTRSLERCTTTKPESPIYWTLDPIDGTKGFLRGDQYAISLALVEKGRVVMGILGCPNWCLNCPSHSGALFIATSGQGASHSLLDQPDEEISLERIDSLQADKIRICESFESKHTNHTQAANISRKLKIDQPPLRMDSQGKYAALATGEASIYLRLPSHQDYREKVWDHAAGHLLVQEVGGTVSDIHGTPLDFSIGDTLANNRGVVATTGTSHDRVIEAISLYI